MGVVLDGYPIYGPYENNKEITRADLDICGGKIGPDGNYMYCIHFVVSAGSSTELKFCKFALPTLRPKFQCLALSNAIIPFCLNCFCIATQVLFLQILLPERWSEQLSVHARLFPSSTRVSRSRKRQFLHWYSLIGFPHQQNIHSFYFLSIHCFDSTDLLFPRNESRPLVCMRSDGGVTPGSGLQRRHKSREP